MHIDSCTFQEFIFHNFLPQYTIDITLSAVALTSLPSSSQGMPTTQQPDMCWTKLSSPSIMWTTKNAYPGGWCFCCGWETHTMPLYTASRHMSGQELLIEYGRGNSWYLHCQLFFYKHNGAVGPCINTLCKNGPHFVCYVDLTNMVPKLAQDDPRKIAALLIPNWLGVFSVFLTYGSASATSPCTWHMVSELALPIIYPPHLFYQTTNYL
jgi:hypothetical protein